MAQGPSVDAANGSNALGRALVFRALEVGDSGQRRLAVSAFDGSASLVDALTDQNATGRADSAKLVLAGIVRVARALTRPTRIRHCSKWVGVCGGVTGEKKEGTVNAVCVCE